MLSDHCTESNIPQVLGNSIADLFNTHIATSEDSLNEYLGCGIMDVADPLAYWQALLTTPRQELFSSSSWVRM